MKKRLIIILSACLLIALIILLYMAFLKSTKKTENKSKFKNDYVRSQYVNDFAKKEEGTDPNKDVESSSGYTGIFINNKQELLKCMKTENMITVSTLLNNGLKYISQIYIDSQKFKNNEDINNFYNRNSNILYNTYGINDIDSLKVFISKLKFLENSQKINTTTINNCRITEKYNKYNEIHFDFTLKTASSEQTFDIKVILQSDEQKDNKYNKLIYWN